MKKSLLAAALLVGFAASAQQTPQLVQPCTMASGSNYCQPTTATNALPMVPADAVNYNNTTLANGTVTNGLFSSGTVTNPTSNQVVLGPIDTMGASSWSFFLNVVTGSGASVIAQESESLNGPWSTIAVQGALYNQNLAGSLSNAVTNSGPVKARYLQFTSSSAVEVLTLTGYLRSAPFVPTLYNPSFTANFTVMNALSASAQSNGSSIGAAETTSKYLVEVPYSIPETTWQYSTAGTPITTATTTQLNAAGAANVRNYITGIQCDNTGALGTEVQILDGATVIWDRQIGAVASAQPGQITLPSGGIPLRGSAATAISLKTVSGTTISLLCSVQGYQAY